MPRCFPDEPEFLAGREAERCVWRALRDQLPDEAALFHSVNLQERGREHEIDLLVVWPGVGLAAVEVKGGAVRRTGQGWTQESQGQSRPIGSPVLQAQDAKKVLTRMLADRTSTAGHARAAHLVALPFTSVPADWSAPDLPRACLLDSRDLPSAATRVRTAVEAYGAGSPLSDLGFDAVVAVLVAHLTGQRSLLSDAEEHEHRVERLTREQGRVLHSLRHYRRLKVVGVRGPARRFSRSSRLVD